MGRVVGFSFIIGLVGCLQPVTDVPDAGPQLRVCGDGGILQFRVLEEARGCTSILGTLAVSGPDSTLEPLSALTTIDGGLNVSYNLALRSLAGLERLQSASSVSIAVNQALENVTGLERLTTVESIYVGGNRSLSDLEGFASLASFSSVNITNNERLTSLRGLHRGRRLTTLTILNNPALTSLNGLESLTDVTGDVTIRGNGLSSTILQQFAARIRVGGTKVIEP